MNTRLLLMADATTKADAPNAAFGDLSTIELRGGVDPAYRIYLYVPLPDLTEGSTIVSALLDFTLKGAWAGGPHTVRGRRLIESWQELTLTHNNPPDVDLDDADSVTIAITNGADGAHVQMDVAPILNQALGGQPYFGIRLEVDTAGVKAFHSAEAPDPDTRPFVDVNSNVKPDAPIPLKPRSGRVVSIALPKLFWLFGDADDEDSQAQKRIQVATADALDADGTFVDANVVHDSGWLIDNVQEYDLALTAMAAVPDGATRFWRVWTRDNDGQESDPMPVESWKRVTKGVLTVNAPGPGSVQTQVSPTITHTLATRATRFVEYVLREGDARGPVVWELAKVQRSANAGVAINQAIPSEAITIENSDLHLTVRVWDSEDRVDLPGDRPFQEVLVTFQYAPPVTSQAPVSSLTVVQKANGPGVTVEVESAVQPSYFTLWLDGRKVQDKIWPIDTRVGASNTYRWTFYGAKPKIAHTYQVRRVVAGEESINNPQVVLTTALKGVWLVVPDTGLEVAILGPTELDIGLVESGETHRRLGARAPTRFIDSIGGYEGTINGQIKEGHGQTVDVWKKRFIDLKDLKNSRVTRLVYRKHNYPVLLGQPGGPKPMAQLDRYTVALEVAQTDEFETSAVV